MGKPRRPRCGLGGIGRGRLAFAKRSAAGAIAAGNYSRFCFQPKPSISNDTPHVLLLAEDITQRKQAEAELLKALAREKELSQLKSNFVSMVSHEFRTPLGIIQSSAELLRDFYQKMQPGERDEQLESIARNTRRMAGMMEGVLVLSRLDAGKLDFQPAALDLNAFCRRVVDEVLSATNRRCPIELSLSSIPSASARRTNDCSGTFLPIS